MTTIYGYVKLKETSEPIAGVVVSVYARDMAQAPTKAKTEVSDPFQLYTRSLGSTITNAQGEFRIEFDLKTSEASKAQGQPELMLAVLAPATTESVNKIESTPPSMRLLHWTKLPLLSAGSSEALMIRLLQEQLKKFNIQLPSERVKLDIDKEVASYVAANQDTIRFHTLLKEKLAPIRKERFEHRRSINKDAKKFVAKLRMTPKSMRLGSKSNFVAESKDIGNAIVTSMTKGLTHMAEAKDKSTRIFLTDEDFKEAGLSIEMIESLHASERVSFEHEDFCRLINVLRRGPELIRARDLLQAMKDEQEAPNEGEAGEGDTTEPETSTEEPLESTEAVNSRVLGQIAELPIGAPVTEDTENKPLTREELNALLPQVSYGAGPSDVAAIHDFFNLQIAFEHVWTEAFDEDLRTNIQKLYEDIVQAVSDSVDVPESESEEILLETMATELGEITDYRVFVLATTQLTNLLSEDVPDVVREVFPDLDHYTWNQLDIGQRTLIINNARQIAILEAEVTTGEGGGVYRHGGSRTTEADTLREEVNYILRTPDGPLSRIERLLSEMARWLAEPYAFQYYAPNAVNFGVLLTYRQSWEPGSYQVGDLVSTIPLAPGEKRKFATKQVAKRTRSETELDKALASRSREMTGTSRAESEIVNKASLNSNFKMTAEGTFNFAIGDIKAGSEFAIDQSHESSRVKKDFREAVIKAAHEYKQERSVEVKTTDELTTETTTSGELSNPNNELTVTYLLYELERQYTISERIHRVTPVVLVAQDIPGPHEITESWLLTHDWILRRVLLDDSLQPALDCLSDAFAGEEVGINVRKANWEKQLELMRGLEATVDRYREQRNALRQTIIQTEEERELAKAGEPTTEQRVAEAIFSGLRSLLDEEGVTGAERMEARRKAMETQLRYLEETLQASQERLIRTQEALNEATKAYTQALEAQTNRRVAIDQLRIHVKENILYYMQAIWDHEPPDQRFFRLADVDVALPESGGRVCTLRRATSEEVAEGMPVLNRDGTLFVVGSCSPPSPPADYESAPTKKLVQIADLDRPLGYKGNYIIFPLKTCLHLTDFMMHEFFDDYFGVRDPDVAGNFTTEELLSYTEAIAKDPETSSATLDALNRIVMRRLQQPIRDKDLVVVPTGELYMEALMGEHPLLEKFKLTHRGIDAAKARAELREAELENLRKAARLLQEEPNLEDPDVDKRIVVEGASDVHVETP
jgi:hypothetical protein